MIPGSQRNLFKDQSFVDSDNAYTKADKWPAGGTLQAKVIPFLLLFRFWASESLLQSLKVSSRRTQQLELFGLWRVRFPPCLVRPGRRRLPVQGLSVNLKFFFISFPPFFLFHELTST